MKENYSLISLFSDSFLTFFKDLPDANDSDSDCMSESCSDSGTDWEQAWTDSQQAGLERLASKQGREGSQPDGDKIGTHHKERIICDCKYFNILLNF